MRLIDAICEAMQLMHMHSGAHEKPATNAEEIEDRRAQRYYGYDPHNSSAPNTMRKFWIPCRLLDERISLANQLQLTPHQDW